MDGSKIIKQGKQLQDSIEQVAYELFGEMGDLAEEDQKKMNEYYEKLYKPTDVNFYDLIK